MCSFRCQPVIETSEQDFALIAVLPHPTQRQAGLNIKFGNDVGVTFSLTYVSVSITKHYLAHLRDVFSRHT